MSIFLPLLYDMQIAFFLRRIVLSSVACLVHAMQHTHHNLAHLQPQYCVNYNDVFLLIVSTKK